MLTSLQRPRENILADIRLLIAAHQAGALGGEIMPEDVHPKLDRKSAELCLYFTLPMALNYQRNSYALWRAATAAYEDAETKIIFDPSAVVRLGEDALRPLLMKYKVGLQPTRHPNIWHTICQTLIRDHDGDVRTLFKACGNDIGKILQRVQIEDKRGYPYLSGPKIANYWLYVMSTYTDTGLKNRAAISVAPDTHVMQASYRLGVVAHEGASSLQVALAWKDILAGTSFDPIDVHTPLWLWSRGGFQNVTAKEAA